MSIKLTLQTKLILMMVFILAMLMIALTVLYVQSERILLAKVHGHAEQLVKAIEVSVERLTTQGSTDEARLGEYIKRLNKKGINEVSIISSTEEIIASTDPTKVGSKSDIGKKRKDLMITAVIGEEVKRSESTMAYDLIVPVVMGKEQLGYIHLILRLDELTEVIRYHYLKRLFVTAFILTVGIVIVVIISRRYIQPIDQVIEAAGIVASGNLDHHLPEGRHDEIGELMRSFNLMTEKLRESRELEERLRRSERLTTLGQLSSGIAHEIRNPLNLISLTIDYIRRLTGNIEVPEKEEIGRRLIIIKEEIRRLNTLVENFLNFGKMKKPEFKEVAVSRLIEEVSILSSSMLRDNKVAMNIRTGNHIPPVDADAELLKSCILNIIINAVQAMPGGGKIEIASKCEERGSPAGSRYVRITIADTGHGIKREDREKVFEPYYTTREAGLGLGLSLAKNIVESHGGTISIRNGDEAGAVVDIELPVSGKEGEG